MSMFTLFDTNFGEGYYSGMNAHDGGVDYMQNGTVVDHHSPDALQFKDGNLVLETDNPATGTHEVVVNGQLVETHHDNVHGGEDIYHGTEQHALTIPNAHGGVDIYDGSMQQQGMTFPNIYGGEDYLSHMGNASHIMGYEDPLRYSGEYIFNPFDLTGNF